MNSCSQTGTYPAEGTDITVNSAIIRQKILKVTLILDKPINHHICQSSLNNLLKNFPKIRENNATNVKIKAFFYMRFHRFILNVHNMTNVSGKTDIINEKLDIRRAFKIIYFFHKMPMIRPILFTKTLKFKTAFFMISDKNIR